MKKINYYFLFFVSLILLFNCNRNDENNTDSANNLSVEIILTQGKSNYMKIVPADKSNYYDAKDVKEFQNVSQANFILPNYADHFYLTIQGSQKMLNGYVKINGRKTDFTVIDWYYQATYYSSDFK